MRYPDFKFTGTCSNCKQSSNSRGPRERPSWETVLIGDQRVEVCRPCSRRYRRNGDFVYRGVRGRVVEPEKERRIAVLIREGIPRLNIVKAMRVSRRKVETVKRMIDEGKFA